MVSSVGIKKVDCIFLKNKKLCICLDNSFNMLGYGISACNLYTYENCASSLSVLYNSSSGPVLILSS